MATQAELIAQAKRDWEAAKLANNKTGMATAKQSADTASGYLTDPSGTTRIPSYQDALTAARNPITQPVQTPIQQQSTGGLVYEPGVGMVDTATSKVVSFDKPQQPQQAQSQSNPPNLVYEPGIGWVDTTTSKVVTPDQPKAPAQNDLAKQLAEAQRQKVMASLNQAYQKNIGNLNAEQQTINPLYAGQTRQAVTQATMAKKSFSDFLAEKGLSASGLAGQGEISQNIAMQSELGGIETRRTGALADIERIRTGYGQDLALGQQQAESDINMSLLENQLRQQEADRQQGITDTRYSQEVARDDAALARQLAASDRETAINTIGQYSNDYQAEINRRQATPDTSDDWLIPYLKDVRQQKIAGIEQNKAKVADTAYERAFKEQEARNKQALELLKLQQAKDKADADRKIAQQKANKTTAPKATKPKLDPNSIVEGF